MVEGGWAKVWFLLPRSKVCDAAWKTDPDPLSAGAPEPTLYGSSLSLLSANPFKRKSQWSPFCFRFLIALPPFRIPFRILVRQNGSSKSGLCGAVDPVALFTRARTSSECVMLGAAGNQRRGQWKPWWGERKLYASSNLFYYYYYSLIVVGVMFHVRNNYCHLLREGSFWKFGGCLLKSSKTFW